MDGRRQRSSRTREAVLRTVIASAAEGVLADVDAVAMRSGTSRRTIFRLFGDVASMRKEALEIGLGESVLSVETDGIPSYVTQCVNIYGLLGPLLADGGELLRGWQDDLMRAHFGEGLYTLQGHAIAALTSWAAWRTLRTDRGCTQAQAVRVLEIGLGRLLR